MAELVQKNIYLVQGDRIEPTKLYLVAAFSHGEDEFIIYKTTSDTTGIKYARIIHDELFVADTKEEYKEVVMRYLNELKNKKKKQNSKIRGYQDITEKYIGKTFLNKRALEEKKKDDRAITNHLISYYTIDDGILKKYQGRAVIIDNVIYASGIKYSNPQIPEDIIKGKKEDLIAYITAHDTDATIYFVDNVIQNIEYCRSNQKIDYIKIKNPVLIKDQFDYIQEQENLVRNHQFEKKEDAHVEEIQAKPEETPVEERKPEKKEQPSRWETCYAFEDKKLKKYLAHIKFLEDGSLSVENAKFVKQTEYDSVDAAKRYLETNEEQVYFIPNFLEAEFHKNHGFSCQKYEKIEKKYQIFYAVTETGIHQYKGMYKKINDTTYLTNLTLEHSISYEKAGIHKGDQRAIEAYIREENSSSYFFNGDISKWDKEDDKIELKSLTTIESRNDLRKQEQKNLITVLIPYRNGKETIIEEKNAILLNEDPLQFEVVFSKPETTKKIFNSPEEEKKYFQTICNQSRKKVYVVNEQTVFLGIGQNYAKNIITANPNKVICLDQITQPKTVTEEELIIARQKDLENLSKMTQVFQKRNKPKVIQPVDQTVLVTEKAGREEPETLDIIEEQPEVLEIPNEHKEISHELSALLMNKFPDKTPLYVQIYDLESNGKTTEEIMNIIPELRELMNQKITIQKWGMTKEEAEELQKGRSKTK